MATITPVLGVCISAVTAGPRPLLQGSAPAPQATPPPDPRYALQLVTGGGGSREPDNGPRTSWLERTQRYAVIRWRYQRGDYSVAVLKEKENIGEEIDALFELASRKDKYFVAIQELAQERKKERPQMLARLKKMTLEGRRGAIWPIVYLTPLEPENISWLLDRIKNVSTQREQYDALFLLDLFMAAGWIRTELPHGIDLVDLSIFQEHMLPHLKELMKTNPVAFNTFENLVYAFPENAIEMIQYLFQVAHCDDRAFPQLRNMANRFFELHGEYEKAKRRIGVDGVERSHREHGYVVQYELRTRAHLAHVTIKTGLEKMAY